MHPTCCGCHRKVSKENAKNILNDELIIDLSDGVDIPGPSSKKLVKLHYGVELLTGYKVSKAEDTAVLCIPCCQKVESFMEFRKALLATLQRFLVLRESDNKPESMSNLESFESPEHQRNIMAKPNITVSNVSINDNNVLLELNNSVIDESETNDSLGSSKLPNDQENNDFNDSENSNEVQTGYAFKEVVLNKENIDIELEIDVYSGQNDEIVELAVPIKHVDLIDLTGSESEEVCDYEPTAKKN